MGGPPPRNSNSNRQPLGSRLGPRLSNVQDEDDLEMEQVGVMSRVVVEKKSRDDALAEEGQKNGQERKTEKSTDVWQFVGYFAKIQARRKSSERSRTEKTKNELFTEKKKQEHEIRILKVQVDRIEQFETW